MKTCNGANIQKSQTTEHGDAYAENQNFTKNPKTSNFAFSNNRICLEQQKQQSN